MNVLPPHYTVFKPEVLVLQATILFLLFFQPVWLVLWRALLAFDNTLIDERNASKAEFPRTFTSLSLIIVLDGARTTACYFIVLTTSRINISTRYSKLRFSVPVNNVSV